MMDDELAYSLLYGRILRCESHERQVQIACYFSILTLINFTETGTNQKYTDLLTYFSYLLLYNTTNH